jgi:hypothetical protein
MCTNEVMIPGELDTLLGECDRLGMVLSISPTGGVRIEYSDSSADSPTPEMLERLRFYKPAILSLLIHWQLVAQPDPVLFVARNLDIREMTRHGAGAVWLLVGDRPYYRLTPRVFYWLVNSIEHAHNEAKKKGDHERARQLFEMGSVLPRLSDYVHAHFRPDQLRRGRVLAKSGLPVGPTPKDV